MVTMMVFVVFILSFAGLVTYMPTQLYSSAYQSKQYIIPSEFESWKSLPRDYALTDQIPKNGATVYDFTSYFNTTQKFRLEWHILFENVITVDGIISQFLFGYIKYPLLPVIDKELLLDSWDSNQNISYIIAEDYQNKIELYFQDHDGSRNDIGAAWDDGLLNCTMAIPTHYSTTSKNVGATEIIIALLTFKLPEIFYTLNPLLGFIISIIFYVPIAFIFFNVIMIALHGD